MPAVEPAPPPSPPGSFGPCGLTPVTDRRWLYVQMITGKLLAILDTPDGEPAIDPDVLRTLVQAPELCADVRHVLPRLAKVAEYLTLIGGLGHLASELQYCATTLGRTLEGGAP